MFNIDIASLRDPATVASLKGQITAAASIISAFEFGEMDAATENPYQASLNQVMRDMFHLNLSPAADLHSRLTEAYNLGWDTVRLQRGVTKNAK